MNEGLTLMKIWNWFLRIVTNNSLDVISLLSWGEIEQIHGWYYRHSWQLTLLNNYMQGANVNVVYALQ